MSKKNENPSVAESLGSILAVTQDLVDKGAKYVFTKMQDFSSDPEVEVITPEEADQQKSSPNLKDTLLKVGKKAARFVGDVGQSYYDEYEKRKK